MAQTVFGIYACRSIADTLYASHIGDSINGSVYGASRSASSYPTGGDLRSLVCRQYRNGDCVSEEPEVVARSDAIDFHKEYTMHIILALIMFGHSFAHLPGVWQQFLN